MDNARGGPLQDPAGLYAAAQELLGDAALKGLPMLMGFTGFADAGHAVEQITGELLRRPEPQQLPSDLLHAVEQITGELLRFGSPRTVAEFDVDQLLDYRARR